jgi:recombination protein RecA
MELGLQLLLEAATSQAYDMMVLDSWPALLAAYEEAKAMSEATMAEGARLFNRFWRAVGEAGARKHDGTERPFLGVVVNQWRDKIGGWRPGKTSPGGHGKDYSYYVRVDLRRDAFITVSRDLFEKPVKVGQTIAITTIKNKAAAPQQVCKIDAYFRDAPEEGHRRGEFDLGNDYVEVGILYGVIEKTAGTYHFGGQKWVGKPKLKQAVREDRELQEALRAEVLEVSRNPHLANTVTPEQVEDSANSGRKQVRK